SVGAAESNRIGGGLPLNQATRAGRNSQAEARWSNNGERVRRGGGLVCDRDGQGTARGPGRNHESQGGGGKSGHGCGNTASALLVHSDLRPCSRARNEAVPGHVYQGADGA